MALTLAEFNGAAPGDTAHMLGACLDIDTWVREVQRNRPYTSRDALLARGLAASAGITWDQVATALARHPRIGERPVGRDAVLSAGEQAGVHSADLDDFATGNAEYEKRFGHIFLICAAGLSGEQMLAALRQRMNHDSETEHRVVMSELRKIADLRLQKAVSR